MTYFLDHPHKTEPEYGQQELGFQKNARKLARSLVGLSGPFTVGIHGPWGSGKTTFCELLCTEIEQLAKEKKFNKVILRFNAWQYGHEEIPILSLLAVLAKELEKNPVLRKMAGFVRSLIYCAKFSMKGKLPIGEVGAELDMGKALEREKALGEAQIKMSVFQDAWDKLETGIKKQTDLRLFIFIDDLDRCPPNVALDLIEQIKLALNLPQTIFILAMDKAILEQYVVHRYREHYQLPGFSIDRLLDKLIQLQVELPAPRSNLKNLISSMLDSHHLIQMQPARDPPLNIEYIKTLITICCADNPRAATRLINRVLYFLYQNEESIPLKQKHLEGFTFQEGLKVLAPNFYREISSYPVFSEYVFSFFHDSPKIEELIAELEDNHQTAKPAYQLLTELVGRGDRLTWLNNIHPLHPDQSRSSVHFVGPVPYFFKPSQLEDTNGQQRVFELWLYNLNLLGKKAQSARARNNIILILNHLMSFPHPQRYAEFCFYLVRQAIFKLSEIDPSDPRARIPKSTYRSIYEAMAKLINNILQVLPDNSLTIQLAHLNQILLTWTAGASYKQREKILKEQFIFATHPRSQELFTSESFYLYLITLERFMSSYIAAYVNEDEPSNNRGILKYFDFSQPVAEVQRLIKVIGNKQVHFKELYPRNDPGIQSLTTNMDIQF